MVFLQFQMPEVEITKVADGEGNLITLGRLFGTWTAPWPSLPQQIVRAQQFTFHESDVILVGYPKSGEQLVFPFRFVVVVFLFLLFFCFLYLLLKFSCLCNIVIIMTSRLFAICYFSRFEHIVHYKAKHKEPNIFKMN